MRGVRKENARLAIPDGRDSATVGVIRPAAEGTRCDVCGTDAEVADVVIIHGDGNPDGYGSADSFYMCTLCAAVLIEKVSRFPARRQVAHWYEKRDNTRNIRLTNERG